MSSFNFTGAMLDEGATITFGSWIFIANGSSGFNSHLADTKGMEESAASAARPSTTPNTRQRQTRDSACQTRGHGTAHMA
jgi:hypothetical protein